MSPPVSDKMAEHHSNPRTYLPKESTDFALLEDGYRALSGIKVDTAGATSNAASRIQSLAQASEIKTGMDMIPIAGTQDDVGLTKEAIAPRSVEVFAILRTKTPEAKSPVIGPKWDNGERMPGVLASNEVVRESAAAAELPLVDALAADWLSRHVWIEDDNVQCTAIGHEIRALEITSEAAELGMQPGA